MQHDRILVPVDFSDCSRMLVSQAALFARRLGADITLLHVVAPPDGLTPDTPFVPDGDDEATTVGQALVDAAWRRMPAYEAIVEEVGVPVEPVVDLGVVADRILEHQDGHGMIIMGTHGRRGLARMLMGSVAEQVTRRASLPVMTVRTEHRPDCEARSCAWCASHLMPQDIQARHELDG
ncbi:MAG: universal stress protein [Deltaproteobacteria bacterium]|nr:MAG: universal stress protein [Deltaproteobacteria bacterium]